MQTTAWVDILNADLRPDKKRIKDLEKVRNEYNIPDEVFAMRVLSSHVTTRKVQRDTCEILRYKYPEASERELLKKLLRSRYDSGDYAGHPISLNIKEAEYMIADVKSIKEFCDVLIKIEDENLRLSIDQVNMCKRIDEILQQEENEKIEPAEQLIQLIENAYYELKLYNPDKDEHWLLANTWFSRYSKTKEAKKRGKELMNFIAYKDTLNYSVLLSPESIRGLALFLVYKELGEEMAKYYVTEFNILMEKNWMYKSRSMFLEKYKENNPITWEANQEKTTSEYSIYWLLHGVEDKYN